MTLSLKTDEGRPIKSTFQVCQTNRPLWSVGKICDSGCKVVFTKDKAEVVQESTGKSVCSFQRQGGLYIGSLKLSPAKGAQSFQRQGGRLILMDSLKHFQCMLLIRRHRQNRRDAPSAPRV